MLLPFGAKNTIKYNLVLNISEKIRKLQPQKILITEAEKHLSGIREIIKQTPNFELSLTTQLKPMSLLLNLAFGEKSNVTIRFESIYTDCLQDEKFDYIYSLPIFGYKPDELGRTFITRDSDGVATQNMLGHLNDHGTLDIIVRNPCFTARFSMSRPFVILLTWHSRIRFAPADFGSLCFLYCSLRCLTFFSAFST